MKTRIAIACIGLCIGTTAYASSVSDLVSNDVIQELTDLSTGTRSTDTFSATGVATVNSSFKSPLVQVRETPVAYADRDGQALVSMLVTGDVNYVYCVNADNINVGGADIDVVIGAGANATSPKTGTNGNHQCAASGKDLGLQIKGRTTTGVGSWPISVVFDAYGI